MTSLVDSFDREKYWWSKELPCPFWGGESIPIQIEVEDWTPGPTTSQVEILHGLLARTQDFRPYFEEALFHHYKNEIYGYGTSYSPELGEYGSDDITPPIEKPSEIWSLIDAPVIWIRYVSDGEWDKVIRFVLTFACHWDEEHGLSIEVADWKITSFDAH